jgi:hypothetical protein
VNFGFKGVYYSASATQFKEDDFAYEFSVTTAVLEVDFKD